MLATPKQRLDPLHHFPPHLREVCQILALGLVRLQRRTAEEFARDAAQAGAAGDIPLHFTARQSVHAEPLEWVSP